MGGRILWVLALSSLFGCAGDATYTVRVEERPAAPVPSATIAPEPASTPPAPVYRTVEEKPSVTLVPPPVEFQPAFYQALRWSFDLPGKVTLRFKVPVQRAGKRLRVAFLSGASGMQLHRATVARAGDDGRLAADAVALSFGGDKGALLGARERIVSDPLRFEVARGEELYVSFVAEGSVATSAIDAFPQSFIAWGDQAFIWTLHDEAPRHALAGLTGIDVEAQRTLSVVAVGDSITEGYVSGRDDARNAWPHVAAQRSGVPVANAAVSGQGVWGGLENLDKEVGVLEGVTDCVVLLGTNDLGGNTAQEVKDDLRDLFWSLGQRCRVWAATLLPKEKTSVGDLATVNARRAEVNAWIREEADVAGVIDLEAVVRDPQNPERFLPGLGEDGIHPSVEGQRALGEHVGHFLQQLEQNAAIQ